VRILDDFASTDDKRDRLAKFRFVVTGGTYERVIERSLSASDLDYEPIKETTREFIINNCGITRLPPDAEGGVILLSYFIAQGNLSILWPFFTPHTGHWLSPQSQALIRLCDQWHVKRLMNAGSVEEWFATEADRDAKRNLQSWPPKIELGREAVTTARELRGKAWVIDAGQRGAVPVPTDTRRKTIALISHDDFKNRMADFAIDYERELEQFSRILTTGTTGGVVADACPRLKEKIMRYHSGPKGGDIEIATEILYGRCHVCVFFVDPLHPHPHIEDIRVLFGACMIQDTVRILTNELQAREWMDRVVKGM
jgi:methylglyoxal synthase